MTNSGIYQRRIDELPIAVIDFETTGMLAGPDRVVEVSVVRVEPGQKPYLAFDTLVNPQRSVGATYVHHITDRDVANAPTFGEIAGDLADALSGCIIAAYNVYFDIRFLQYELSQAGIDLPLPHFCLMYMRPMLGLGDKCGLACACEMHNIRLTNAHCAYDDAMAAAQLMSPYLGIMNQRNIKTYHHLSLLRKYKFVDSFQHHPLPKASQLGIKPSGRVVSRAKSSTL